MSAKIYIFESDKYTSGYFRNHLSSEIKTTKEPLSETNADAASEASIVSTFIYSKVTASTLSRMPQLKLICTRSTGLDHIDIEECAKRRIIVCNVPKYGENTVAEHAFALILALTRKLKPIIERTNRLDFDNTGLKSIDLNGKTLGVIGAGAIGLHCVRIGIGFGMNVLVLDKYPQDILSDVIGFRYTSLNDLLSSSDVISIHVPLTNETKHIINMETIHKIKRGAILINTSRGEVIDTQALVVALDVGILQGVGLDVIEGETSIKEELQLINGDISFEKLKSIVQNYTLIRRSNVIITPHIGFYSREAEDRILNITIENIQAYIAGKPKNAVIY